MTVVGSSLGKGGAVLHHLAGYGADDESGPAGPTTDQEPRAEHFASGIYDRPPADEFEPTESIVAELGDDRIQIGHLDRDSIRLANFGRSTPYPQPGQRVIAGHGGGTIALERRPGTREDDLVVTLPYQRNAAHFPARRHTIRVGDIAGAPGVSIVTGQGLSITLSGDQIRIEATQPGQSIRVASSGRVSVESPDVRLGPGAGRPVACVGDMITGSLAAIATGAPSPTPIIVAPSGTPGVPFVGRIISGSANVRGT